MNAEPKRVKSEQAPTAPKLKRTPLYPAHRSLGAKMTEFGGWEMPVQYSGIIDEHVAVRTRAGLFDVSHMGEVEINGGAALEFCQKATANDVSRLQMGQAQYSLLLNESGGVVDDVVVYRLGADRFLVCVNAANTDKDVRWLQGLSPGAVAVEDRSADYVQLALQGPLSEEILQQRTAVELKPIKPFRFARGEVASVGCLIARTGYTGEDGFELFCGPAQGEKLWRALLEAGAGLGLKPVGLGARDTLRLERALPLYGHELSDATTPLEAGLDWVVKFSKGDFVGRDALIRQKADGIRRRLVGLELTEPGIARSHYPIFCAGRSVGEVTSGTKSPTLGKSIALGYVLTEAADLGTSVAIDIRGRLAAARVVRLPFYRR